MMILMDYESKRLAKFKKTIHDMWNEKLFNFHNNYHTSDSYSNAIYKSLPFMISETITIHLIESHLNYNWNWYYLTKNKNITLAFIQSNLQKPWDWVYICKYLPITIEFIESIINHPISINLNWVKISTNVHLTHEFIEKYKHLLVYRFQLSYNKNVPMEFIIANHDKPWDLKGLSLNNQLTFEYMERITSLIINGGDIKTEWDWSYISKNKSMIMEIIEETPYKPWDYNSLSANPNLTLSFIETHINENWNWGELSDKPFITLEFIETYINENWNFHILSNNSVITIEFVKKYKYKPWCWIRLSMRLPMTDIVNNIKEPWDWKWVSENLDLTEELVNKYNTKKWDYDALSKHEAFDQKFVERIMKNKKYTLWTLNPNITMDFVTKNKTEIEFKGHITEHSFKNDYDEFFRRNMAAYIIQNKWKDALVNPFCQVGANHINAGYNKLCMDE